MKKQAQTQISKMKDQIQIELQGLKKFKFDKLSELSLETDPQERQLLKMLILSTIQAIESIQEKYNIGKTGLYN